ncbi:MAG: hypothetical protein A2V21_300850 [Deltaproteobacteria bacterium GWC2_55_46]|nr:MAG: hypothetical protein A2Z79_10355 [Deltaproteobacteria bacterium GWA2_55_82]OIJ72929.1 MAG: hypothetical protein A2V21_300850 [Deltaproteobacteria bacterium GWC2_55_46]
MLSSGALRKALEKRGWLNASRHDYKKKWLEATEKISSRMETGEVKSVLSAMIGSTLRATAVNVWLHDQASRCYISTSSRIDYRFRRVPESRRLIEHMLSAAAPFEITGSEDRSSDETGLGPLFNSARSCICAPLIANRELVGFVILGPSADGRTYASADMDLLRAVATQAAVQIKNIRLSEALLDIRETDSFNRMSSFIMHDLKNFTNSLSLLSHNARSNITSPEFQREAIKAIDLTVAKMKALVEKMAAGAGSMKICPAKNDLLTAFDRAVKRLSSVAASRVLIKSDGPLPLCSIDAEAVETVFFNILMNAHDAASHGEIRAVFEPGDDFICVRISDTGTGIPQALLEKGLFRPFMTTKSNGFGVGLYQCKTIMEAHEGLIEVETEEGSGTRFTLKFPNVNRRYTASRAS